MTRVVFMLAFLAASIIPARGATVPIAGGTTTVSLDSGFVGAVTGLGLTVSPTGTANLTGLAATFPITGGTADGANLVIAHDGSGLRFAADSTTLDIGNFLVNTLNASITGAASNSAGLNVTGVPLFDIGSGLTLTLTPTAAGAIQATFPSAPDLTGALVGTAAPAPVFTPEPATGGLVLACIGLGIGLLRGRIITH